MLLITIILAIIEIWLKSLVTDANTKITNASSTKDVIRIRRKYKLKRKIIIVFISLIYFLWCIIAAIISNEPKNLYGLILLIWFVPDFIKDKYRNVSTSIADNVPDDFILYLRGFNEDKYGSINSVNSIPTDCFSEINLAHAVNEHYPLIAIGMTKELDAPFGAQRIYLEDSEWQDGVKKLILKAKAVIILLHDSKSCHFEITNCLQCSIAFKTYCIACSESGLISFVTNYSSEANGIPHCFERPLYFRLILPSASIEYYDSSLNCNKQLVATIMKNLNLAGGHAVKPQEPKQNNFIWMYVVGALFALLVVGIAIVILTFL
jgi:hypothetical protein